MSPSPRTPRRELLEPSELLAFAPILLTVWDDGVLSSEELSVLRRQVVEGPWLDHDATESLASWMDPERPPDADTLVALGRLVRDSGRAADADPTSLTTLGVSLWAAAGAKGPWRDPDALAWLGELERLLGVVGREAARRQLGAPAQDAAPARTLPTVDPESMRAFLDRTDTALRDRVLQLLTDPRLRLEYGLSDAEHRARVLSAIQLLADEGLGSLAFPEDVGGAGDPAGSVAVFETLAYGDLSVLVKFGVQFGLFGGSVLQLGTERHHRAYLPAIGSLELPGCYAMTETGHGSNVRDLETEARYHHEERTLEVHSPNERSGKDWIGNAALHGRMATVFARLIVGEEDHGVHAVLVPIRDADGAPLPGVRIEDRGPKIGLNGVDNGRIWFDRVQVPVESLLDRFAQIDAEGRYQSPIPSAGRRFFTMLGTLVAGRVSIASAAVSATKKGLVTAVRYTARRRQFGPDGGRERPVLDYLALQRTLLPPLATTYGLHFAVRALQRRFAARAGEVDPEVEVLAAGLKAYASDHCVSTLQAAREACGGQGYLEENGFAALKADTDIFTTFEGANLVLYQLVAKGLLSRYREELGDVSLWRMMRVLGERAESRLTTLNPVVPRRTDEAHLLDPQFHLEATTYREDRLLRSVAVRMRARLRDGVESFHAVNEVQDHLVALAKAHVERVVLEAFQDACAAAPNPGISEMLSETCALYALSRIEADRGWFLEAGYLEPPKSRAIRAQVNALCGDLADVAEHLVGAFGVPEPLLPAIARSGAAGVGESHD